MLYRYKTHTDFMPDGSFVKCFATDDYFPNCVFIHEGPSYESKLHRHPNIEIKYIFEGALHITVGENEIDAKPGDLIITNANTYHSYLPSKNVKYCTIIFNTDYISSFVSSPEHLDFIPLVYGDKTISRIFSTIEKEYFERPIMFSQNADAMFHELIIHLVRHYLKNPFNYSPVALSSGIANSVNEFLSHNFHKKLTIETIADTMGFNRHYMMRAFKKETGITIAQQLKKLRLNHAEDLMKNTLKSVSEVASLTGFESVSHFSREFKEAFGATPAEYREKRIN